MNKKLTDLITKKLTELDKLLEEIKGYQIEPNDQEMWDPDYYYDLKDKLEEVLKLLEDNPITDKPGICSLIDEYSEDYE